jgi:hypothetical protein
MRYRWFAISGEFEFNDDDDVILFKGKRIESGARPSQTDEASPQNSAAPPSTVPVVGVALCDQ